jgi:hypothetical protein
MSSSAAAPSRSAAATPSCTNCKVPINLCHCSQSCCSSCSLGVATGCACVAPRPPPPKPCTRCLEAEEASKALTKQVAARDRELAEIKKKLAEARATAQSERESRANIEAKHAKRVEELEAQLGLALSVPQSQPREAELERQLAQSRQSCWEAEARAKSSDATCIKLRDELSDCRLRLVGVEEAERLAAEGRLAYVAEAAEMHAAEAELRAELAEARREASASRDASRAEGDAVHAALRLELLEAETARQEVALELEKLSGARNDALAYEGAVAESRRLQGLLRDADAQLAPLRQRVRELEGRVEVLATEKSQLAQSLAHAERVKELFGMVTSRTNQVQEAANEVIEKVAARKRAAAAGRATTPAQSTATATAEGGRAPGSASARDPLQAKPSSNAQALAAAAACGPWPPPLPAGARKGLPAGRPGAKSAFSTAR